MNKEKCIGGLHKGAKRNKELGMGKATPPLGVEEIRNNSTSKKEIERAENSTRIPGLRKVGMKSNPKKNENSNEKQKSKARRKLDKKIRGRQLKKCISGGSPRGERKRSSDSLQTTGQTTQPSTDRSPPGIPYILYIYIYIYIYIVSARIWTEHPCKESPIHIAAPYPQMELEPTKLTELTEYRESAEPRHTSPFRERESESGDTDTERRYIDWEENLVDLSPVRLKVDKILDTHNNLQLTSQLQDLQTTIYLVHMLYI